MKPEIVEELARALLRERHPCWSIVAEIFDKNGLHYNLDGQADEMRDIAQALAPIIDRLVSGAREEGWRDGIEEAAGMADRWNVGIGEAIRNMKGPDHD